MTDMSWRRMATWTIRLLLVAVLGAVAFTVTVLTVLPQATHGKALTVLTGSMSPGIPVGSVVVVRPVDPGTLRVGDIATYQKEPSKPEYVTHRIIRIDTSTTPESFTFKGDANRGADIHPVPASAIRGKVWFHVPYLGGLRDTLHTRGGLAGVAMLLLAGYAVVQGVGGVRERKRATPASVPGDSATPLLTELAHQLSAPQSMILATLHTAPFEGLAPQAVANLLSGMLVDETNSTFTVLVAKPADAVAATVALLELFEPVSLQTTSPSDTEQQTPSRATPEPAVESHELETSVA